MDSSLPHRDLLREACELAIRHLAGIDSRSVFPRAEDLARLVELDRPLPDAPTDARDVLRRLDQIAGPCTVASQGGRAFAYVIGGAHPAALAADWMTSAWDQNAVFHDTSPAAAAIERAAMRWVLELLELPPSWRCAFVTGTTMAHVTALATARHAVLERVGWDVERDGLFGAPPITVIASEQAHGTLDRALAIVGLGAGRVVRVPADEHGRTRVDALPRANGPTIVCAQIGNVNGGACDPLREIASAANEMGAWLHVDGAFGLWARAAPTRAHCADGLELVDSCAADLHKWLNVPYDNGVVLVRDRWTFAMRAALSMSGAYYPDESHFDPGRWTPEASRRARGITVWAVLAALGRSGVADLVERTCAFATRFAEGLRSAGYEVLAEVPLNQVLVSFGSDDRTRAVTQALVREGTCWCSPTIWRGRVAMRISVSSWATTGGDVERSLAAMIRAARSS